MGVKRISRQKTTALKVAGVQKGSIAEELGVEPGDLILQINGKFIRDLIDFKLLEAEEQIEFILEKKDGEQWLLEIEKDCEDPLGIETGDIVFDGLKLCNNKCIFCFVDQTPHGVRKTLSLKDDDYRFSFLQGSFITLNNLSEAELKRIVEKRLSPLYISVHTTNPRLRMKMMGNPRAAEIMERLDFLAQNGIRFHAQAVLCPGINDGPELERTISDLFQFYPRIRSLALVPVGLTGYRQGLYPLKKYDSFQAGQVIDIAHAWQHFIQARANTRLVFPSDEFFLLAGRPIPSAEYYEGYPQLENGVGLTRCFWEAIEAGVRRRGQKGLQDTTTCPEETKRPVVVTGELGGKVFQRIISMLEREVKLDLDIYIQQNTFFGREVTVAGLLTGQDFKQALKFISRQYKPGEVQVLIPGVALNEEGLFLDGLSVEDLKDSFPGLDILPVNGPDELLNITGILGE